MATVVELLHLYYDTMISVLNMTEVVKLQLYPFIDIGEFFHYKFWGWLHYLMRGGIWCGAGGALLTEVLVRLS